MATVEVSTKIVTVTPHAMFTATLKEMQCLEVLNEISSARQSRAVDLIALTESVEDWGGASVLMLLFEYMLEENLLLKDDML